MIYQETFQRSWRLIIGDVDDWSTAPFSFICCYLQPEQDEQQSADGQQPA